MASGFDVTIRIAGREDVSKASVRAERSLSRLGSRGSRALRRIGAAGAAVRRSLQAVSRAVVSLSGLMAALGIVLVAGALLKAASDAEEVESKFRTVFRNLADETDLWATSQAKALKRSRFALREYLAQLQDTFVPMGIARDKAADLSKQVTTLAIDLASFNNLAEADVINALTSALVGNVETVRQFGVVITQATIGQELLNMGIMGGVRAATEQQKILARLNLILKGTTDAQGDAARTSGSFANQLKAAKAVVQEVSVAIGEILIPVVGDLLGVFNEDGPKILKHIENFRLGLVALGAIEPKDAIERIKLEIVGLRDELKNLSELSVGAFELGVEGFRARAEIIAELREKTVALTAAIESQAEAQLLAARAAEKERKEEEALIRTKKELAALEDAIAFVRKTFGDEALSFSQRQAEETRRFEEQLTKLNKAFAAGAVDAAFFGRKANELASTLFDLRRAQSIGDLRRALGIEKVKDAINKETAEVIRLVPALDDAGKAAGGFADKQKALGGVVDLTTDALLRNAAAARESAAAAAAFGRGPIADLLSLLQLSPSDPRRRAAGGGFAIMDRLRGLGFSGGISLAQHGAILDRPTALIGGEAGRELVVPAQRSQRSPEVQAEFERLMAAEGGGEITIIVPVNLDGRVLSKIVARHKRRAA